MLREAIQKQGKRDASETDLHLKKEENQRKKNWIKEQNKTFYLSYS